MDRRELVAPCVVLARSGEHFERVGEADLESLARLTQRALRGTVDDHGRDDEYRIAQLRAFWMGDQGELIPDAMLLLRDDGRPVSFILTTLWKGSPFVCYLMTEPRWQKQGIASALLGAAASAVLKLGHAEIRLRVTAANPAYDYYLRRGFTPAP